MRISKLAAALAIVLASSGAFAQSTGAQRDPTASTHRWYQASERERFLEEQRARLEREGFPQYTQ